MLSNSLEQTRSADSSQPEEIRERESQVKVARKIETLQKMALEKEATEVQLYDLKKKMSSLKKLETLAKLPKA